MRIHLLSDLHLERGPYVLPSDLDFDVLVAPGDISDKPEQAINFLKAVGKPVVLVLGNHDYWSGRLHGLFGASDDAGSVDMADRLAEFKRLAAGTQIHVLEREFVILPAGGKRVRFLGATLWTSYGNGNQALMEIGSKTMNDTAMIGAGSWIDASKRNARTYEAWRKSASIFYDPEKVERRFEPPVALDIHTKTVAWLARQLKRSGSWDHTVVVTHHWPSWDVLLAKQIVRNPDVALNPEYWQQNTHRPDREENGVNRLASYGSPMETFVQRHREQIDAWCCGHVHCPVDTGLHGVRLVANPRGYPYNKGDNLGNAGREFDERKVIDLGAGVMPALVPVIEAAVKEIDALTDELGLLAKYVDDESDQYQLDIMRATFDARCREINQVANAIAEHINSNLEAKSNYGLHEVISPADVWARWQDPFHPEQSVDAFQATGQAIRRARDFLRRLRVVHRKPKQFHRVQEYLVAKAVRRLAAQGICVRVSRASDRFIDGDVSLHVEDGNGRTYEEMLEIIDQRTSPRRGYQRSLFRLMGA